MPGERWKQGAAISTDPKRDKKSWIYRKPYYRPTTCAAKWPVMACAGGIGEIKDQ